MLRLPLPVKAAVATACFRHRFAKKIQVDFCSTGLDLRFDSVRRLVIDKMQRKAPRRRTGSLA
jgi:hypothetical protein